MQMRVDEAWNDDLAGNIDLGLAAIVAAGADDAVAADGNVRLDEFTRSLDRRSVRLSSTMSAGTRPTP